MQLSSIQLSSIHYSMMAGQIGDWLLDIGYLHIQPAIEKWLISKRETNQQIMLVNCW